jgi:hypothetical protein
VVDAEGAAARLSGLDDVNDQRAVPPLGDYEQPFENGETPGAETNDRYLGRPTRFGR